MKLCISIFAVFALMGCSEATATKDLTRGEVLEQAVIDMESEVPMYWLEMENVIGEWEKTVLVFGYGNNSSACDAILNFATAESPNRNFRCTGSV